MANAEFAKNVMTAAGILEEVKMLKGEQKWQGFTLDCIKAKYPKAEVKTFDDLRTLKGKDTTWLQFQLECLVANFPLSKVLQAALEKAKATKPAPVTATPPKTTSANKNPAAVTTPGGVPIKLKKVGKNKKRTSTSKLVAATEQSTPTEEAAELSNLSGERQPVPPAVIDPALKED